MSVKISFYAPERGCDKHGDQTARYLYIEPIAAAGAEIKAGDPVGRVQDLGRRYAGITSHTHIDVVDEGSRIEHEPKKF